MSEQGSKAGRAERHKAAERARKERKRMRKLRGEIYAAIRESERLKRSKKRGCADLERNMRALGFEWRSDDGTLDQRYERVS